MENDNLVCKYCSLRQRDTVFSLALAGSFEDNMRILGTSCLKCLDVDDSCREIGCKFAEGVIDPFAS